MFRLAYNCLFQDKLSPAGHSILLCHLTGMWDVGVG